MSKKMKTLKDLLTEQVKDLYYAEKQILKALPKMIKKASSAELKAAFEGHLEETEVQVERLEKVFEMLDLPARGKTCPAIDGIIEEGKELMQEEAEPPVMDAGLIAAAQKVEHYEIASYGCVRTYANLLGLNKISELLQETLDEEGATDHKLTAIAENINMDAMAGETMAGRKNGR
jgi:ferritin-like metal-binding protein YciE